MSLRNARCNDKDKDKSSQFKQVYQIWNAMNHLKGLLLLKENQEFSFKKQAPNKWAYKYVININH